MELEKKPWGKIDPRLASNSKKRNLGVNLTKGYLDIARKGTLE